jgi:hypothetical protein
LAIGNTNLLKNSGRKLGAEAVKKAAVKDGDGKEIATGKIALLCFHVKEEMA